MLQIFAPVANSNLSGYLIKVPVLLVVAIGFVVLQLINSLFMLLDEVLFWRYRRVPVNAPVFIVGVPRSGTTTVHRKIEQQAGMTSTALWECLFAPSITQRKLVFMFQSLDAFIGSPLQKCLEWLERGPLKKLSTEHEFGLNKPEEDFVLLLPILQCFLLTVPFPNCQWLWRFATADDGNSEQWTRFTLNWYRRCIQRHLYCYPEAKRYLAKNPSFSGVVQHLAAEYPDSQIVLCERDAPTAVRSQLRVLSPLQKLLSGTDKNTDYENRLLTVLKFYYQNLDELKTSMPEQRCKPIAFWDIATQPEQTFAHVYRWLNVSDWTDTPARDHAQSTDRTPVTLNAAVKIKPVTFTPKTQVVRAGIAGHDELLRDFQKWRCHEDRRL